MSVRATVQVSNRLLLGHSAAGRAGADLEPAAGLARCLHLAARCGDDVLHDREAEPCAAARARLVAAVEALEQARQVGCADTLPVVRDREHRAVAGGGHLDDAAASWPGVADRIREQVLEHDAQPPEPPRPLEAAVGPD